MVLIAVCIYNSFKEDRPVGGGQQPKKKDVESPIIHTINKCVNVERKKK